MSLHLFSTDEDAYVVAETADEAAQLLNKELPISPPWNKYVVDDIRQLPDDVRMTVYNENGAPCTRTCGEHAERHGKGFFAR